MGHMTNSPDLLSGRADYRDAGGRVLQPVAGAPRGAKPCSTALDQRPEHLCPPVLPAACRTTGWNRAHPAAHVDARRALHLVLRGLSGSDRAEEEGPAASAAAAGAVPLNPNPLAALHPVRDDQFWRHRPAALKLTALAVTSKTRCSPKPWKRAPCTWHGSKSRCARETTLPRGSLAGYWGELYGPCCSSTGYFFSRCRTEKPADHQFAAGLLHRWSVSKNAVSPAHGAGVLTARLGFAFELQRLLGIHASTGCYSIVVALGSQDIAVDQGICRNRSCASTDDGRELGHC